MGIMNESKVYVSSYVDYILWNIFMGWWVGYVSFDKCLKDNTQYFAEKANHACPQCSKQMKNLGNLSNRTYSSYPAQWDNVYVCEKCKVKKNIRVVEGIEEIPDVRNYKEIK